MKKGIILLLSTLSFAISNAQNVGVGTTSPSDKLHIKSASGNSFIRIDNSTSTAQSGANFYVNGAFKSNLYYDPSTTTYNSNGALLINNNATSASDVVINLAGGNVGIGVAKPLNPLEVSGKIKAASLQLTSGANNTYVLQSDGSGNATWVSPTSIGGNIYNSDGTLTATRTVTMGNNHLIFNTTGTGNVIVGTGEAGGSPVGGTLRAPNAGSGNTAGGALSVNGGFGWGSGPGGSIFISGGSAGGSGGTNGNAYIRGGYGNSAEGNVYLNDDHTGNVLINGGGGITGYGMSLFANTYSNQVNINRGLTIDYGNTNNGTISSNNVSTGDGISFGGNSGEGIASNRVNATTGQNQFGIDIYTNSTRRLSVTNGGSVGIGTTAPATLTEISGATAELLKITSTTGGAGNHAYIDFETYSGAYVSARIGALDMGSNNGSLVFETGNAGTASTTTIERMRILNTGFVGINTTVPSNMLNIGAGNGQGIDIGNPNDQLNVSGGGSYAIRFYGYRDVTNYVITAKIAAQRTYVCCSGSGTLPWLEQGTDLVFSTNNGPATNGSSGAPADNTTERMRIKDGGFVGIGTSSPLAPLDVNGSASISTSNTSHTDPVNGSTYAGFSYLSTNGGSNTGYNGSDNTYAISIRASNSVLAQCFFATSDARIKDIIGRTDNTEDLNTLRNIKVTNYTMRDKIANGNMMFKKVIAQELNETYPTAVKRSPMAQYIPNIYQTVKNFSIRNECLALTLAAPIVDTKDIHEGSMCKVYITQTDGKEKEVKGKIIMMTGNEMMIKPDQPMDESQCKGHDLFVYGTEISDLLTVDYEAISMLNVSATQELAKQLAEEQKKNQLLNKEVTALKGENTATRSDIEKLKASVETLQQIVGAKAQK